jgi:hypothetical protein
MCAFVRRIRFALPLILVVAVGAAVLTSVASGQSAPSLMLSKAIPGVIRIDQQLVVKGKITNGPAHTRISLELGRLDPGQTRPTHWSVATTVPDTKGGFELRWRVTGPAYRLAWLRVVALHRGQVIAATSSYQTAIGPKKVYCAPPVPPATMIPVCDGWIVGGPYGEGGPFPGIYACLGDPYTVTATNSSGKIVASQHVAALHSYTLVVPAGRYSLAAGGCHGQATVRAGRQTTANSYCLYP